MTLISIQQEISHRVAELSSAHPHWPCRKGCDDCCRSLAAQPSVTQPEWAAIAAAIDQLPPEIARACRDAIRQSASATRPVVCPLLNRETASCRIYNARPVVCRTYGFYAERHFVLGCHRVEQLDAETPGILWGNHLGVESRLAELGESAPLAAWLARDEHRADG